MSENCTYPLDFLVMEICRRAGLPSSLIDVSDLAGHVVQGYMLTSEHLAFTHLQTLSEIYFFDPSNYDGILHFKMRGGPVVATIPEDDVLESVDDADELTRRDTMAVPKILNLSYYDTYGGLQPDRQYSDRSLDTRSVGETTVSTPVIMLSDQAKQVTVITHKLAIQEQMGEWRFSLPDSYIGLTVGDPIIYRTHRLRITKIEIDDGFQNYHAVFERQSALVSSDVGQRPELGAVPKRISPGPTTVEIIDSHIITDRDDELGFYIAVTGEYESWRGAIVELSMDGGANYSASYVAEYNSVIGTVLQSFGMHSRKYPDTTNIVEFEIISLQAAPNSVNLAEMMNRSNLVIIGDELINIGEVEEIEEGIWQGSNLLRGRKGSTVSNHFAGERIVVMSRSSLEFIPADLYLLNKTLTFRATSLGSDIQTVTTVDPYIGRSQIERRPAYLSGYRVGSDAVISWQGVGRLGGGATIGMGKYFVEYVLTVGDDVYTQTAMERTVPIPSNPTVVSVRQRNSITGLGPKIEVTI